MKLYKTISLIYLFYKRIELIFFYPFGIKFVPSTKQNGKYFYARLESLLSFFKVMNGQVSENQSNEGIRIDGICGRNMEQF